MYIRRYVSEYLLVHRRARERQENMNSEKMLMECFHAVLSTSR